ncbi:MAG: hypothetical protein PHY48_15895 [Candidatus Cloacimonetes bacterium]|nr:hypothetical protein [Candidatus Cloacimonadota bacterium]
MKMKVIVEASYLPIYECDTFMNEVQHISGDLVRQYEYTYHSDSLLIGFEQYINGELRYPTRYTYNEDKQLIQEGMKSHQGSALFWTSKITWEQTSSNIIRTTILDNGSPWDYRVLVSDKSGKPQEAWFMSKGISPYYITQRRFYTTILRAN